MKVNDYKFWKGRIETAPDDSTGAFDKFVQDSSSMDQEPRNMYNQGSSVDHAVRTIDPVQDSGNKIEEVLKAYGRYRGSRKGKRPMKFKNFFELYATENFAEGGQAGQLVQPNDDGSRPGYSGKDQYVISDELKEKIKEKIKLKPGQKWNFYNPETGKGNTYGIKKSDNVKLYDVARNVGKEGRAETKLKKATEKYQEIKANPKKLAEKKSIDKERYLANREEILENSKLKYETDKQWRKAKLEYERIQRTENPEKYRKKMSDWYAKRGKFPPGNNYKENVWHDMFRSSQKNGQTRFLLVDENGNQLTQDKFPKVNGKVRWDKNANYKNVKFYDTVTKQFVKLDNSIKGKGITFEKYLNQKSVGGKGAYENAINGYRNKDTIKNITFKDSKGKNIRIGTVMRDKLVQDNNNFIKSGINVQHPDIDNAFWKNEISTTSSNNRLNNLETILKRELRNAGDNIMLRNKALSNFKTKINKLPGGITKIIEGITYGNAPSTESVVAQVGKDFKIDRFKNFPKTNELNINLLKLAGTVDPNCRTNSVNGGRIGFKLGSGSNRCLAVAKKASEELIKSGKGSTVQKSLLQKIVAGGNSILKNTGSFVKGALNPVDFFRLKNLIGLPAAIAAVATDTVSIFDDVVRKGQPFDVAAGNEFLTQFLDLNTESKQAQRILDDKGSDLSPAAKEYAQGLVDIGKYENLEKEKRNLLSLTEGQARPEDLEKIDKQLKILEEKLSNFREDGALDYNAAVNELGINEEQSEYIGEPKKAGMFYYAADDTNTIPKYPFLTEDMGTGQSRSDGFYRNADGNRIKVNEYGYATKGNIFDIPSTKGEGNRTLKADRKFPYGETDQGRNPALLTEGEKIFRAETKQPAKYQKPFTYKDFNYQSKALSDEQYAKALKYYQDQGFIKPGQKLEDVNIPKGYNTRIVNGKEYDPPKTFLQDTTEFFNIGDKWKQALYQPGMLGANQKFAGGGIAGLSGGDKSGRPPESGPASQGLRSLFNNGKKR